MRFIKPINSMRRIIVDDEDAARVKALRWNLSPNGYPQCSIWFKDTREKSVIRLHHFIAGRSTDLSRPVTDHINGNKLDARKKNLRFVTYRENTLNACRRVTNTSGVIGVVWVKATGKWKACHEHDDRSVFLGEFKSKAKAIAARRQWEKTSGHIFAHKENT